VLEIVAPAWGLEIDTDGGALLTVTEMETLLERPTESVAVAVIVCVPSASVVVSTDSVQLVVPVAATAPPESTFTATHAIPAALAAEPETTTVPDTTAPADGCEIDTPGDELLKLTLTEAVEERPRESVAIAETVWAPSAYPVESIDTAQLFVLGDEIHAPESTRTWRAVTPARLEDVPEAVNVPTMTAPACGDEIETAGGELLNVTLTEAVDE
jgi:hypothetical protein